MIILIIGIFLWICTLVFCIGTSVHGELLEGIFVGFFAGLIVFLTSVLILSPKSDGYISSDDYYKALGAKTYLEKNKVITLKNMDEVQNCINILEKYQDKRDDVLSSSKSSWDGIFYSPNSLKEYPPIQIPK